MSTYDQNKKHTAKKANRAPLTKEQVREWEPKELSKKNYNQYFLVRRLIQKGDLNTLRSLDLAVLPSRPHTETESEGKDGETFLCMAIYMDIKACILYHFSYPPTIVPWLISMGANVNESGHFGGLWCDYHPPLSWAVSNFRITKLLIDAGANPNNPDRRYQNTPLHGAVNGPHHYDIPSPKAVEYLLSTPGADVNARQYNIFNFNFLHTLICECSKVDFATMIFSIFS